jgi:hypothetical protein
MIDPKETADFEFLWEGSVPQGEVQCVSVESAQDIQPGTKAVLQLAYYNATAENPATFYFCSDILYTLRKDMTTTSDCSPPLSDEAVAIEHPPPHLSSKLPSHGSLGSVLGAAALLLFAYVAYAYVLPRIRRRQRDTGDEMEMTKMVS